MAESNQNWRAGVAVILVIPPNLPGLINAINPRIDVGNAMYPYRISWLTGVRVPTWKEPGLQLSYPVSSFWVQQAFTLHVH